jgi:hypothetical protein
MLALFCKGEIRHAMSRVRREEPQHPDDSYSIPPRSGVGQGQSAVRSCFPMQAQCLPNLTCRTHKRPERMDAQERPLPLTQGRECLSGQLSSDRGVRSWTLNFRSGSVHTRATCSPVTRAS